MRIYATDTQFRQPVIEALRYELTFQENRIAMDEISACKRNNSDNSDRAEESATDNVMNCDHLENVLMIMESLSPSSCRRDAVE